MKVVAVFPAVPRPFGDTAARWYFVLVKSLLCRGDEVVCITVSEEPSGIVEDAHRVLREAQSGGQLKWLTFSPTTDRSPWVRRIRSLLKPFSETVYAPGLREALKAELQEGYDILHLEQLWSGWLGDVPRALLNVHHFEIIDLEDRPIAGWRDGKTRLQMARATHRILKLNRDVRVFTPRLMEKAREINPRANYRVIPFALDLTLYELQPTPRDPVLGLIGSMHWIPSRSAAERLITRIWPLVKKRVPNARLLIAGWNAKKYLGKYMPADDVTLKDSVAHPTDFFSKVSAMVYAPSRGSGMKIKVLESMAYGVPVVTTWEGVEGIEYENGVHCYVEETDDAIAARTALLLTDQAQREQMRKAARRLLEDRYSPEPVIARMLEAYEAIKGQ
jgi:glycosyltransferase involved in cell wall biosynthesis